MSLRNKADIKPIQIPTENTCHFLTVDETKRPRANSDPVGLHLAIANLPEITVTAEDGQETGSSEDSEVDAFLIPPPPRPRSNTCPDDMFKLRRGRPPTPPPADIARSPGGKRFSFNYNIKDLNGISFAHHRLSKVSEDGADNRGLTSKPARTYRRASCLAALAESTSHSEEPELDVSSIRLDNNGRLNHSHSTGFLSSLTSPESDTSSSSNCHNESDQNTQSNSDTIDYDSNVEIKDNKVSSGAQCCLSDSCYASENGKETRGKAPLQAC